MPIGSPTGMAFIHIVVEQHLEGCKCMAEMLEKGINFHCLGSGMAVCLSSISGVSLRPCSALDALWYAESCHSADETENALPWSPPKGGIVLENSISYRYRKSARMRLTLFLQRPQVHLHSPGTPRKV